MFPQSSPGWASSDWYSAGMGPPSSHSRTASAQISFDNAYNFHGSGVGHVMSQPPVLQDFPVQLSQHHPFTLTHHESPGSHSHSLGRPGTTRAPHTPTSLMYPGDPSYHPTPVNGQGLPYHVSMTGGPADKTSLLVGSSRQPVTTVHHQGNLQPGYPPRQVETSSLSCDLNQQNSTGYPGSHVTGPGSPLVTQDQRVTSSSRFTSKDPPPPPIPGLYHGHPPPLTSPNNQPTFLAFRAAEVPAKNDDSTLNLKKLDLSTGLSTSLIIETQLMRSNPTRSNNQDCLSSNLSRTTAAPHLKDNEGKVGLSTSFVSVKKALIQNSTSNKKFESTSSIITVPGRQEYIEDFPRLDGNFEFEQIEEKPQLTPTKKFKIPDLEMITSTPTKTRSTGGDPPKKILCNFLEDHKIKDLISNQQQEDLKSKGKLLEDVSPQCNCEAGNLV